MSTAIVVVVRALLAAALFVGAFIAWSWVGFDGGDDVAATAAFVGTSVAFGCAIGRWRATLLSLLLPVMAVVEPDPDSGVGELLLTVLAAVPICAVAIAAGVLVRRLARRSRRTARA